MIRRRTFAAGALALSAAPFVVRAQQPQKIYRVAIANGAVLPEQMAEVGGGPAYMALLGELRRLGYVEGVNLIVERRSGRGRADRFATLAEETLASRPDVVVASGTALVREFAAATKTTPIVFSSSDPVV